MNKITLADVKSPAEYEPLRDDFRRRVIDMKKRRRLSVGDRISLVFENRDTVLFQIQEMVRAERMTAPAAIQDEIDVYSRSIPGADELSATMFIEITERESIREEVDRLIGVNETVTLRIGEEHVIPAVFEPGWSREDRVAAVQYVKFPLTPEQREAFRAGNGAVVVEIAHPNLQARAEMPDETRRALAEDLAASDGS
jgi:hypothetical protein